MSKNNFETCIEFVLTHEGGYVDHPNDKGGPTNHGISLRFLKTIHEEKTCDDIWNLTKDEAKKIYKEYWWDKYKYHLIEDVNIAAKVLDFSINMGPKRANKLIQSTINSFPVFDLDIDGVIGFKTIKAINEASSAYTYLPIVTKLNKMATTYYTQLALKNKNLKCFLKGWLMRANSSLK